MATITINNLPTASTIDGSLDLLPIYTASSTATQSITRNTLLNLSSDPVGKTDIQTLTNKTLTSPTINGATLSGTLSGTYTIGGTPTFPASVVQTTASQVLTNKTLTSPTLNNPTINNATLTTDAVTGYTVSNTGTVFGVSVSSGQIGTAGIANNAITNALIATGNLYTTKMYNPYKFSAYRNAAYTMTTSAFTKMPLDTKEYDTSANYDNVTNFRFTAPVNGFYFFTARVASASNTTRHIASLFVNGSEQRRGTDLTTAAAENCSVVSGLFSLNANDYVELYYYTNGGTTMAGVGNKWGTYFNGYLVSTT